MGDVRLRRTAGPITAVTLGLLAAAGVSLAFFAVPAHGAEPRPDPKPVPKPRPQPPPPPPAPPPVAPPPAPPPSSVVIPPPGPSAAEIAARERQRMARLAAQRRAARRASRLAAQRRAMLAAQRQAAEARRKSGATRSRPAGRPEPAALIGAADDSPRTEVAVVLGALGGLALALLAFAAIPAHRVPSYWFEQVLQERREQFALVGLMCVVALGVVSALVLLGG